MASRHMAAVVEPRTETVLEDDQRSEFVPGAIYGIALLVLLLIPFKIISQGFLPDDDALADAAKAVNGRSWTDILVLKDTYSLDPHIGWHAFLSALYHVTGWSPHALVIVSSIGLFGLLAWSAIWWLDRPEAWLATLVIAAAGIDGIVERYMRGRPFLISAAALTTILLLWQRNGDRAPSRRHIALMSGCVALSVGLHGSWYLWALPLAAFYLAGQRAWGKAFAMSCGIGIVVGAVLTGHPVDYLVESVRMGLEAFGHHVFVRTLVPEFQPMSDNIIGILFIAGVLIFRRLVPLDRIALSRSPAFWLACLGWALGYRAERFWVDWGLIALLVVIAGDLSEWFTTRLHGRDPKRIGLALGLAAALYLVTTNDARSRWSGATTPSYLSLEDSSAAGWLPQPGGVLYSGEMALFYQTFFRNPDAPWRYMVGFEPAMMPDADFAVYQTIMWNHGNPLAYLPWVRKLRPEDRIGLHWPQQPGIPALEWRNVAGVWMGRLPRGG